MAAMIAMVQNGETMAQTNLRAMNRHPESAAAVNNWAKEDTYIYCDQWICLYNLYK